MKHQKRFLIAGNVVKLVSAGVFLSLMLSLLLPLNLGQVQAAPPEGTSYIIVFKDGVDVKTAVPSVAKAYGLQTGYVYEYALKGMSAVVPAGRLVALQHDPRVDYISEDFIRTIEAQTVPTGIQRIFADDNANIDIDGSDDYRVDVDVAVIDTGIDLEHPDLNVVSSTSCLYNSGTGRPH